MKSKPRTPGASCRKKAVATKIRGDASQLSGDVSGLHGSATSIVGDARGLLLPIEVPPWRLARDISSDH